MNKPSTRLCLRCRKVFIVTQDTIVFHQSCKVTGWSPEWGGKNKVSIV